jgi:hypothetical protein
MVATARLAKRQARPCRPTASTDRARRSEAALAEIPEIGDRRVTGLADRHRYGSSGTDRDLATLSKPPRPPVGEGISPAVTQASLQADLLAAHERAIRLHARIQQLEKRLSEALDKQAWRESGLGAPADIDALTQQIAHLEQQAIDLRLQLEERAPNRELMAQLNAARPR